MKTVYILLPEDLLAGLKAGNDLFPEDIPDPWGEPLPQGTVSVYPDQMTALSEQASVEIMQKKVLRVVELQVPPGRLLPAAASADPATRLLLASGVRSEDVIRLLDVSATPLTHD